jgi:hypothetical protein
VTYTRESFQRDLGRAARRVDLPGKQVAVQAPTWIVRGHDSAESHVAYRSALRTLCGIVVERGLHGRGQHGRPTCPTCAASLERHRLGGFVGAGARCFGLTKQGKPCQRAPLPGGYCPSHRTRG